jgi:hypothetical protein
MPFRLRRLRNLILLTCAGLGLLPLSLPSSTVRAEAVVVRPAPAPGPADNPLKGFVPYAGKARDFPHSLEFGYLALSELMVGPSEFDWGPMERLLDDVASRGCQTVFRIWMEYPKRPTGVPAWLVADGLKLRGWSGADARDGAAETDRTPDYEDPRLRSALKRFIAALGRRYDGDPRIGFVTAGLLGSWGEWHTHPHAEWFASKAVQAEVMDAYEAAFRRTPVLLRYPAGADDGVYASNIGRRLGYHDDSFAWATLETGRRQDSWFYMALMRRAGADVMQRWRMAPIGGEIRPELWPCLWKEGGCEKAQDFARCVAETHVSWLMDSSISRPMTAAERERAIAAARSLGYEIEVTEAVLESAPGRLSVRVTLSNRGVAPFHADWPVRVRVIRSEGEPVEAVLPLSLAKLMPAETVTAETAFVMPSGSVGPLRVGIAVPNPMSGGRPLRFANRGSDADPSGWMDVGVVELR